MDNGDNFNKFICIILDCINEDNLIFSYSDSKFYSKKLNAGDDLYSTFIGDGYDRTKEVFNTVIDNLLKYQKYFNIQSLPKYKIKDTENKIDLQITIPNIFKCIQESFDVENWYYDRMRNRKEEMNKRYVNYPSKGIINNKELMNRTFYGGDVFNDNNKIYDDIVSQQDLYTSYINILWYVLVEFCFCLNGNSFISNILIMLLLSKIHYLIGKYYIINCNYYKTIKMLDQKTLDLFLVNDTTDNYLTYYQKELLQLFNYKFKNTSVDDFNCRNLIAYDQIIQIPKLCELVYYYYDDQNTLESNKKYLIDNVLLLNRVLRSILYNHGLITLHNIFVDYINYYNVKKDQYLTEIKNDIDQLKKEGLISNDTDNTLKNTISNYNSLYTLMLHVRDELKRNSGSENYTNYFSIVDRISSILNIYNNDRIITEDFIDDFKSTITDEYTKITNKMASKNKTFKRNKQYLLNLKLKSFNQPKINECKEILKNQFNIEIDETQPLDIIKHNISSNNQIQQIIKSFKNFLIDNNYVISVGSIDTLFNKLQDDPFANPIKLDEYKILQKGNLMFMSAVFKTIEKNLKAKYYYLIKFKSNVPRYTPYPVIPNKIANIKELFEKYDINHLMNQHIINQFFKVNTLKQIPKFKLLTKSGGSSDINIYHQMLLNIVNKLKLKNISINERDITAFNNKLNKIESIKNELQELVNQVLITNDKDKINDYNNKLTEYNKENHNIIKFLNQLNKFI